MVLLVEQVRLLSKEQTLIEDSTQYTTSSSSWTAMKNYGNIILTEPGIIVFNYEYGMTSAGGGVACNHRLKIGGIIVCGYPKNTTAVETISGICYLNAGTYSIVMEGIADYYDNFNYRKPYVQKFKLGKTSFLDLQGHALAAYSSSITKNLPTRTTCIGQLNKGNMIITCAAYTPNAQTNFQNPGESLTNNVTITVDSVQQSWTDRKQDNYAGQANSIYGAASAQLHIALSVGVNHTVSISKSNSNTVVNISLCFSPWLLTADTTFQPVSLSFPQGSTLYAMLEPLSSNSTKTMCLGKKRAVSFGDATDYYSTSTGTGLLSYNYTFELVAVTDIELIAYGFGACVSNIGVDAR